MHSLDIFGIVFSTCSPDSCAKTSTVFPKGQFFWVTFHDHTIFPCDAPERRSGYTSTYFRLHSTFRVLTVACGVISFLATCSGQWELSQFT